MRYIRHYNQQAKPTRNFRFGADVCVVRKLVGTQKGAVFMRSRRGFDERTRNRRIRFKSHRPDHSFSPGRRLFPKKLQLCQRRECICFVDPEGVIRILRGATKRGHRMIMKMNRSLAAWIAPCGLLWAASALAAGDVEDRLAQSYQVKAGGKFVLEADRGSIEVTSASGDQVAIEVLRKVTGESRAGAESVLKNHEVQFAQDGDTVRVHAEMNSGWISGWSGKGRNLQVRFLISVPKQFNVDLKTAGGSIKVADLTGHARSRTSGGSLNFGQIEGPIVGRTAGGSINVAGCKGDVDIRTSGGSIHLGEIDGNITAQTSGGSLSVKQSKGKTVVKTSGGNIDVAEVKGSLEAITSGGSITASVADQPSGDCRLETSGGSIKVSLSDKVAVDVDAKTSGGGVKTELPVAVIVHGEHKPNRLQGKINGGGPMLSLHTSGGGIFLQKQ